MQPIVFLGPSMPVEVAQQLLYADYRPPIRRGDLDSIDSGRVVGLIDGVFEHSLSVSPREVLSAVRRNVRVVGGGSMGALRAAEVTEVVGVGRIYDWYRNGIIERDDEVALLFDETSGAAVTTPMVNVRYAVERLRRPGTIDRATGDAILRAALSLPYERRRYRTILRVADLHRRPDAEDLIGMLKTHDLKRQDAQAVLETLDGVVEMGSAPKVDRQEVISEVRVQVGALQLDNPPDDSSMAIWESGDRVDMPKLMAFLAMTGRLEDYARRAVSRFVLDGNALDVDTRAGEGPRAQSILDEARQRWGWLTAEEARSTLTEIGIPFGELDEHCKEEVAARQAITSLILGGEPEFVSALRTELFLNDQALKREVMRCASLYDLAAAAPAHEPTAAERSAALAVLCRLGRAFESAQLRMRWKQQGYDEPHSERWIRTLVRARRVAGEFVAAASGDDGPELPEPDGFQLARSPKPPGEPRFSMTLSQAREHAERLRDVIGITRIGMIGELADLGGVHIAQAARPDGGWSSTYGSGKSLSADGAVVGSIMEELEKWSQEQFDPGAGQIITGSFATLAGRHHTVDPSSVDLPHDTSYRPGRTLRWVRCAELLTGCQTLVPEDLLVHGRQKHDICFSRQGARKGTSSNGLGSGFSREEAVLHALCEYVERHAERIAELLTGNPGGLGPTPYRFVDLSAGPSRIKTLAHRLESGGGVARVLDITSEVRIPTFWASVIRDGVRADGRAAHPNPWVAIEMAMLEAGQTLAANAAGGREDLSIRVRSLGRHERPRPVLVENLWGWLDPDIAYVAPTAGFESNDVFADLHWCLRQVRRAGIHQVVVADLTPESVAPAHVVRVIIPGLETISPFHMGRRARLTLLRDMVPQIPRR